MRLLLVSILLICAGAGSVLTGVYPNIGWLLTAAGTAGTIWAFLSSESKSREYQELLDHQAKRLAASGAGNPYARAGIDLILREGSVPRAMAWLWKAIEIDPDDVDALGMLATVLPVKLAFEYWVALPQELDRPQEIERAKEIARRGLKVRPSCHVFYDAMGILCDLEGNHRRARSWFRKSGRYREDGYWHVLTSTSWGMEGNLEKVRGELELAIKGGIPEELVAFEKGRVLVDMGSPDEAVGALELAYRVRRALPQVLERLVDAYFYQGRFARAAGAAMRLFMRLLRFHPTKALRCLGMAMYCFGLSLACRFSRGIWPLTQKSNTMRQVHLLLLVLARRSSGNSGASFVRDLLSSSVLSFLLFARELLSPLAASIPARIGRRGRP